MKNLLPSLAIGLLATAPLAAQQPDPMIAVRAPVVALTHARVIDGRGHAPLENQTLILRDGRIATLTPDAAAQIPEGAAVRDLTGKTVLPGLVMSVLLSLSAWTPRWLVRAYTAFGARLLREKEVAKRAAS